MGSFYTSHTLRGPSQSQVLDWLKDRSAYVSITERSITVVLDKACESQKLEELADLAARLSAQFNCPVLATLNHDDDILYFELYEDGVKTDEYNSTPSYFRNDDPEEGPSGGDASRLARVFGVADSRAIEAVLRRNDYVFAIKRHQDLARALCIPPFGVGIGFNYAAGGYSQEGVPNGTYVRSGPVGG